MTSVLRKRHVLGAEGFGSSVGFLGGIEVAKVATPAVGPCVGLPPLRLDLPVDAPVARGVVGLDSPILLVIEATALSDPQVRPAVVELVAVFVLGVPWVAGLQPEDLAAHPDGSLAPLAVQAKILGPHYVPFPGYVPPPTAEPLEVALADERVRHDIASAVVEGDHSLGYEMRV